jgi:hypothetical protein
VSQDRELPSPISGLGPHKSLLFKKLIWFYFGVGYRKAERLKEQMNFSTCTVQLSDDEFIADINKESQANRVPVLYRARTGLLLNAQRTAIGI